MKSALLTHLAFLVPVMSEDMFKLVSIKISRGERGHAGHVPDGTSSITDEGNEPLDVRMRAVQPRHSQSICGSFHSFAMRMNEKYTEKY